jgi:quinol monooxygenase YgiN
MRFKPEAAALFEELFDRTAPSIRASPGCTYLELWRARGEETVYFTHSHWLDESSLEAYRSGNLFLETWAQTKQWFSDRPEAWSLERRAQLK